jgi:hypothetical protein
MVSLYSNFERKELRQIRVTVLQCHDAQIVLPRVVESGLHHR